ncbi:MAG TPA: DUF5916 domain-containing protein [Longimicrobiales bacterium]|nr:DUF5916 domain-containing protein [Longimicrobiales bacterium]
MRTRLWSMAATVAALTAHPGPLTAQQNGGIGPEALPRPELRLTASSGIHIDGRMDEAAWATARPLTDFVQSEPEGGSPASEATEVRFTYDRNYLYVGAEMFDRNPEGIVLGGLERDSPGILFEEMDAFGLTLDTFLDRRSSFIFFVNPAGGVKDGQGTDDGRARDYGWDGVVDVRTRVHERGWTMEMAIPWRTLRFDPTVTDQRWGMNVMRRIRRKNEVSYWAPLERRNRIFLMSKAGTMTGMANLPAARNVSIKPYALASRSVNNALGDDALSHEADGGLDMKWGITPSLTMDLSWRTDFSQVEVDQEQVNLTRFPVFFPELREFFLENSGTFAFGDMDGGPGGPRLGSSLRDLTLFHSRQIGLRSGSPVPLLGGARLTGRAGNFELGVLNVQSESYGETPAENFSVLRVRRSVLRNSDVGIIFTNRTPTGVADGVGNLALGVDANLRVFGGLFLNTYVAGTRTGEDDARAARLSVGWRDRFWNTSAAVRQVGEDFNPGIGFVRRRSIREGYATVGIHPRPNIPHVLEVNPYLETTYTTNLSGRLETRENRTGFGVSFDDRSSLNLSFDRRFERLDSPFRVREGTSIPVGDYRFGEGSASYRSSQGHTLSFNAGMSGGGYYDGTRFSLTGGVRWQPDRHLVLDLDANHNAVTAQGDSFSADLYSARVQYAVSTTLNFSGFVQYNDAADEMVTNLRADLIHAPLSDLFLLYTERRSTTGTGVLERFVTMKVTRLLIF